MRAACVDNSPEDYAGSKFRAATNSRIEISPTQVALEPHSKSSIWNAVSRASPDSAGPREAAVKFASHTPADSCEPHTVPGVVAGFSASHQFNSEDFSHRNWDLSRAGCQEYLVDISTFTTIIQFRTAGTGVRPLGKGSP